MYDKSFNNSSTVTFIFGNINSGDKDYIWQQKQGYHSNLKWKFRTLSGPMSNFRTFQGLIFQSPKIRTFQYQWEPHRKLWNCRSITSHELMRLYGAEAQSTTEANYKCQQMSGKTWSHTGYILMQWAKMNMLDLVCSLWNVRPKEALHSQQQKQQKWEDKSQLSIYHLEGHGSDNWNLQTIWCLPHSIKWITG